MGTSKIKSIQPNGTYDSQSGLMYKFEIELESGDSGEVSAKSESRWSVGDEVEFEVTPSKWGDRMKLSKPGFTPNSGGGRKDDPSTTKRIEASWAIGQAVTIACQYPENVDFLKVFKDAERLLQLRDELIVKL
tara:strand:- start:2668 stop:3066 length:399 start_codon:yes stop_codon:yes gene_type:complete